MFCLKKKEKYTLCSHVKNIKMKLGTEYTKVEICPIDKNWIIYNYFPLMRKMQTFCCLEKMKGAQKLPCDPN